MWLFVNSTRVKIAALELKFAQQWVHTCLRYNRSEGLIEASVDGNNVETVTVPSSSAIENFNISIGKEYLYFNDIFGGLVTNINIFDNNKSLELQSMSGSPCLYTGDFLSWADFTWLKEGATPDEINVRGEEEVCGQVGSYNLLLPSLYNWEEANKVCSILGNGRVPEIRNTKELQYYVEISKPCQAIWTPYSDEREEGTFVRKSFNPPLSDSQNRRCCVFR